jgi:hypothetical protein
MSSPQDRERLERERHRLVLAKSDMKQAAIAADHLAQLGSQMNGDVERVLWTGLVVTYARPFSASNRVGAVTGQIVKLDDHMQRSLHSRLRELRDVLFAHTDLTNLRETVDTAELLGEGVSGHVESYAPMNVGALPDIARLARELEGRFAQRLGQIERELRELAAGPVQ